MDKNDSLEQKEKESQESGSVYLIAQRTDSRNGKRAAKDATLGAITGASIGIVQAKNPYALSINMTVNTSIASLTFFALREYFVSPLLVAIEATPSHSIRLRQLEEKTLHGEKQDSSLFEADSMSIGQIRTNRLLDSSLAGALAGGGLSSAFRGRATFVKAAFTSALITTALQFSVNQFRAWRLNYLADRPVASPLQESSPQVSAYPSSSFEALKSDLPASQNLPPALPERIMLNLSKFFPVRKLSNQEYLQTLEKKRTNINKRLREIEDEERRMYEWTMAQETKPP
nr:hypothetical protein L204_01773 [Cryptococcus depauperatus CBS 7855]